MPVDRRTDRAEDVGRKWALEVDAAVREAAAEIGRDDGQHCMGLDQVIAWNVTRLYRLLNEVQRINYPGETGRMYRRPSRRKAG
jgi:hypothetical protein